MNRLHIAIILATLVAALTFGAVLAAAPPLPASFYGSVVMAGQSVPAGTTVSAFIGSTPFAQTTTCISADFKRHISPCQFGGNPDCSNCGCIDSAGLGAVSRHRLPGGLRVGAIFERSLQIGRAVRQLRAPAAVEAQVR